MHAFIEIIANPVRMHDYQLEKHGMIYSKCLCRCLFGNYARYRLLIVSLLVVYPISFFYKIKT